MLHRPRLFGAYFLSSWTAWYIPRQARGLLAAMWLITYDDGHGRPVMIRRAATEQEAFDQACVLRRWYDVLSIEGPEGQRHDVKAITEWCLAHSR